MTIVEAISARHSVRRYLDRAIPENIVAELQNEINACNAESGLHIQLVTNEPRAFDSTLAHYGNFTGVSNYIALVGKNEKRLDEKSGYYGERIALAAQMLGLNTCWVALSFSKSEAKKNIRIAEGEKLACVLSLGYGETQGGAHKSKPVEKLCKCGDNPPEWFTAGVAAAILAPTAINQQSFLITLDGDTASIKNLGGVCSEIDLGIVKYHFEAASGKKLPPNQ